MSSFMVSYCLLNIIRVAAVVHVTSVEWKRNAYTLLVVKERPEKVENTWKT